jgi:hypothetical protein
MSGRSYEPLTTNDLHRLSELAEIDRCDLFRRKLETARLYSNRLFAVALGQGGALHFVDGKNGIKDLDVWSFYRARPQRPFPPRRRGTADFGDPKFGTSDDKPNYVGRRVDLIGRSIVSKSFADPIAVLRNYLREGKTASARFLSQKAVVLIEPKELLGTIIWPEPLPIPSNEQ